MRRIERKVAERECPDCGYRIAQAMIERARFDYPCPRCGTKHFHSFRPVYSREIRHFELGTHS